MRKREAQSNTRNSNEHELGGSARWKEGCHGRVDVTKGDVEAVEVERAVCSIDRAGPVGHDEGSRVYCRYNRKQRSDRP